MTAEKIRENKITILSLSATGTNLNRHSPEIGLHGDHIAEWGLAVSS